MPLFPRLQQSLSAAERRQLAAFVILFGITIIVWACLHDSYLIGVEPRHFTEYHRPLLPLKNHGLLAIQYAVVAATGFGMVFGACAFALCRLGSRPPLKRKTAWFCLLPFLTAIEATALAAGRLARTRAEGRLPTIYPQFLYPDNTPGIAYSQTVNLTIYLAAAGFGALYLIMLALIRRCHSIKNKERLG